MARPTVLTERGDFPSRATVFVMGVPAHIDPWFAIAGPLFAVVQICRKSIMIDDVPLSHNGSFLKNIKGMFGRRTDRFRSIRLPRISVSEEGRVQHEVHAGVALRAKGTKLDGSKVVEIARRWLGDCHLTATLAWDQTSDRVVETTKTIVLDFVNHLLEYG